MAFIEVRGPTQPNLVFPICLLCVEILIRDWSARAVPTELWSRRTASGRPRTSTRPDVIARRISRAGTAKDGASIQ